MVDADKQADRIRSQWMRDWLRPFWKSDRELYHTDLAFREAEKATLARHVRRPEAR